MYRARLFSLLVVSFLAACSSSTAPSKAAQILSPSGGQSVQVGTSITVRVSVQSSNGAPVRGAVVTWAKATSTGTLASATSTTDATGSAFVAWTVDTLIGVKAISATVAGIAPIMIAENVTVGAAARFFKVSGDSQVVAVQTAMADLVVGVTDRYGNPVVGVPVAWQSPCTWFVFDGGLYATDASGRAALRIAFGGTAGVCTTTATTSSIPGSTVTFTTTGS